MKARLRKFWRLSLENKEESYDHGKDHKTRQRKSPIQLRCKMHQLLSDESFRKKLIKYHIVRKDLIYK